MALSRELTRRLQVEDEPLSKRLKLAENTFTSEDLPVVRKEDLVLKWLCQIAKKNDENYIWATLSRCLRFKNISGNVILKSDIKEMLVETLIAKLSQIDESQLEDVLNCCEMLFASREMHQFFQFKLSSLSGLMKAVFALVSGLHDTGNSEKSEKLEKIEKIGSSEEIGTFEKNENINFLSQVSPRSRKCAINAVECLVTCYKQSLIKDDFTYIFVSEILYPLCRLIDKSENDRLGAEIHKCVQQLIFGKSRYSQFKEFDGKGESNFGERVLAELRKKAEISDENTTLVVFLYIFRAAVGSYKNDPATIDAIFRYLVNSSVESRIKILVSLGKQLTNITLDYQNKINDTTLFNYLQNSIDAILSKNELKSVDYEALAVVANLNPLILETKIQDILRRILFEKKEKKEEVNSYRDLMIVILIAGVRLKWEKKLVPWILTAIEEILKERGHCDLETEDVFPKDFTSQFSKSVGNLTTMQTIGVFRALIFHLNNCVENSLNDKKIADFLLQVNVDLISAYFEGVRIFDHSVIISGQDKFVQALNDLGKTMSILAEKVLEIKRNKKMIVALLTVTWYWENMYNWMKYYVPDAVLNELEFPISDGQMKQLMNNIDNAACKKAMNRILVQKIGRNLQDLEGCLDLSSLLDGLEKSWSIIIDQNSHIITSMTNSQISELSRFLLDDARSTESMQRLHMESVQNDERFVKTLVCEILVDIATNIDESTTKNITKHVNVIKILDRGKVMKVLKEIKREYAKNEWMAINEKSISVIEKNLKILSCLPLKQLSLDLRTLILLVVYSIKKECNQNKTICELCMEITLDASDKFGIDIIDYVDPHLLVHELTNNLGIRRVIESSLRNVTSWETLKMFIKKSQTNDESLAILLECLERVKPKLKNNQREFFKKAEQKLSKKLLDSIDEKFKDPKDVKRLTVALKVSATSGEITEHLVNVTKSTLRLIFVSDASKDEKLVTEGLQLVNIVLKHRKSFQLDEEVVNKIWPHVLENPMKKIVQPLIETTGPKALSKLFNLLHTRTISGLDETSKNSFTCALIVWDSIMSIRMGGIRHKLRIAALHNLLQILQISNIPMDFWPGVLKLVQSTLSEELHVIEKGIDVILLIAARSLKEGELSACEDALTICSSLVKFHVGFITDRLPVLLALYRKLVRLVVGESRKEINTSRERRLRCLALDIEKFTNALVKLKRDLARISPYVIADLVEIFSEGVIPSYVKGPLEDSVGHFLSISDKHAISLLSRTLSTATQEIFKTLYETYNKFHKFTGKI